MYFKVCSYLLGLLLAFSISGCATNTKSVLGGMLVGAGVGALAGNQFVHHGPNKEYETENTIVTSVVFALLAGGALAWHYQEVEEAKVEISGQYARYRLCDPDEMDEELARQLRIGREREGNIYRLSESQIGDSAISLDDNTKWVFPSFRKRYLQPERYEDSVISKRYIWEVVRPGRFVTRSQNSYYFSQEERVNPEEVEQDDLDESLFGD